MTISRSSLSFNTNTNTVTTTGTNDLCIYHEEKNDLKKHERFFGMTEDEIHKAVSYTHLTLPTIYSV